MHGNQRSATVPVVQVLGPVEVRRSEEILELGGPKPRLLLAMLLVHAGSVVSVDRLLDALWGDDPPETGKKAVQVHVSNLRRALGADFPLMTAPGGYVINPTGIEIDAAMIEEEIAAATSVLRTNPALAAERLGNALGAWNGTPYSDLSAEPALQPEIARLHELRVRAIEQRLDAMLRLGRHADVLGELETLTIEHPYREGLRALQMLALYRSGRQTDALRAYQRTRSTLAEELGIEPSAELRALEQQILDQSTELDLSEDVFSDRFAFLFTDIEDSTAMWEAEPESMQQALEDHDRILAEAVAGNDGSIFKGTGDGVLAVFELTEQAVTAAVTAQRALGAHAWPTTRPVRVRMGIDEGAASARSGDYFGPVLNRVARLMSSGHGGQVLVAESAARSAGVSTMSLGSADYKGVGRVDVHQVLADGLETEFPELRTDRSAGATLRQGFGQAIRGYEIRERLGEGAHGIVYRAYQASVGREVAVKVIRPELANQAAFVKRFEAEAQYVAQLEHPHIVSLYDYWRDPDGAYLAMQWLRGGSLATAIGRVDWKAPAALHLLDQVGNALDYAHRHGVIHRDLKPANVLLDEEGNGYLTDFGIASQHIEAVGGPVASSVAYLAPEELLGAAVGPAVDQYGLALLTYELFTGERPELGGQPESVTLHRPDLPAALDPVIGRAASPNPEDRYPRIEDFLRALRQAFGADVVTRRASTVEIRNPFKGLRAFTETDAQDFHGREELLSTLVDAVGHNRLTAVVGPSGSGKSSLVKAGLIPAARRGRIGASDLVVAEMYPGSFPFEELESALLRVAVDRPSSLIDELTSDDRGLLRAAKQILPADTELLLVIDQFEELFSLTTDDSSRSAFLDSLVTVTNDARSRVRIVLTMRADFFDRPLEYPEFGNRVQSALVAVTMPSDHELAAAIAQPARAVGLDLEDGLVSRILRDVADEPGALPLLQYALTELVAERDGERLTISAYERSGGVVGAVARRAEEIYEGMQPSVQDAARELFVRLVSVDDEVDDARKRARVSDLQALGSSESALDAVMDEFGSFRLLSFDRDPITRGPTVEVAHEALIREWPRYRGWIDERREDLLLERRLTIAADEWNATGQDPSFLLSAGRLDQYEEWSTATDLVVTPLEQEYIDRSRLAADDESTRRRRRRSAAMIAMAALAASAVVLAVVALGLRDRAEEQSVIAADEAARAVESAEEADELREQAERRADIEVARNLRLEAGVALGTDPDLALLLAGEAAAADIASGGDGTATMSTLFDAAATDLLVHRLDADPIFPAAGFIGDVSPDGASFATWAADGASLAVFDVESGEQRWAAALPDDAPVSFIDWDEATGHVVASSQFGSATSWDAMSGELVDQEFVAPAPIFRQVTDAFFVDMVVTNVEEILTGEATLSQLATTVVDRASGEVLLDLPPIVAALVSPDDRYLAAWTFGGTIDIHEIRTGVRTASVDKGAIFDLNAIDWVADSSGLWWVQPATNTLRLIAVDGAVTDVTALGAIVSDPTVVRSGPDGRLIAVVDGANSVQIIETDDFRVEATFHGHASPPASLTWSPNGRHVFTRVVDEGVSVWDISGRHGLIDDLYVSNDNYPEDAVALADGRIFVASNTGSGAIVDPNGEAAIEFEPREPTAYVSSIGSPSGDLAVISSGLGIAIVDTANGATRRLPDLGLNEPLAISDDSGLLIAATAARSLADGAFDATRVGFVDLVTGELFHEFGNFLGRDAVILDDVVLLVGQERNTTGLTEPHAVLVLDRSTGEQLSTNPIDTSRCVHTAAISPELRHLAVSGCDGEVWLYDVDGLRNPAPVAPRAEFRNVRSQAVLALEWLDDERLLIGGMDERITQLTIDLEPQWSFEVGFPITSLLAHGDNVYFPWYDSSVDAFGLLGAPHSVEGLQAHVDRLATRPLTAGECVEFGLASC